MITNITEITQIATKSDMSRWTRAHAESPGINWSVYPGPGGTMIIVEHEEDRCSLTAAAVAEAVTPAATTDVAAEAAPEAANPAEAPVRSADLAGV